MRMYDIISKKRDGFKLCGNELEFFVKGYVKGKVPDYQASAFLMAAFIRGLDNEETSILANLMADSGDRLDLSSIKSTIVDKHSTGGVGDKITLIAAPIVASCGVPVAKMSGKSLGHTGGTIDKLDSIPGFNTKIEKGEFINNVKKIGISITGQTGNLAPADKKIYSLRDVTATVNNKSLVASSIMSKKIASGADKILLDVKTGKGAFMKSLNESIELASLMVDIGKRAGKETVAYITDMNSPLGNNIGNSLEVVEAIEILKGRGPKDLENIAFEIAARMIAMAVNRDLVECRQLVKESIIERKALSKFEQLIERQGGNPQITKDYSILPQAQIKHKVVAQSDGYIISIDAEALGKECVKLGAGRIKREDPIDYSAGIVLKKKVGDTVESGEVLMEIHTNHRSSFKDSAEILRNSIKTACRKPPVKPMILAYVDSNNVHRYAEY